MLGLAALSNVSLSEVGGSFYYFGVTESAAVTEAMTGGFYIPASLSDAMTFSDSDASYAGFKGIYADSISIVDGHPADFSFFMTNAETISLDDRQTGNRGTFVLTSEGIVFTESEATQVAFISALAEIMVLATYAEAEGWFRIDDIQSAGWTNINNYQG